MTRPALSPPHWSTASGGHSTAATPLERSALGDHLGLCRRLNSRAAAIGSGVRALQGFVVTRFVTSLVTLALVAGVVWLAW